MDGEGTGLDRNSLYERLLAQDRSVVDGLREREAGAEGSLDWAWFAEGDVKGVADGERRKVEKQRKDKAEELARKKDAGAGKRLLRTTSRGGEQEEVKPSLEETRNGMQLPDLKVEATQRIVSEFLGAIKESLEAARKAHLK